MVKNLFLTKGTLAAMLLVSPLMAQATSDEYPAADFQPKVLYSDSGYKHSESTASSFSSGQTEADPNYPAAAFKPKVVYQDTNYKHKAEKIASASTRSTSSSAGSSSGSTSSVATKQESSDQTMLIAVVALAVIGFFFYRKKAGTPSVPRARASRPAPAAPRASTEAAEGVTRVERYLAKKQPKETRVSKYLEKKQQSLPTTGVAKYLAKQVVRTRKLAEENVTGVEKYLRKKKG